MDTQGFFVSLFVGTLVAAGLYLWCVNPEVVLARIRFHRGTKRWDRILLCFLLPAVYAQGRRILLFGEQILIE